jgi:hypothetical protein
MHRGRRGANVPGIDRRDPGSEARDVSRTEEERAADRASQDARAGRAWGEFMAEDPELATVELGIAKCARIMVTEPSSSPILAQAIAEDRQLRDRRRAILTARAEARRK